MGNGYGFATRIERLSVQATKTFGSVYYEQYGMSLPSVFSERVAADVRLLTGTGLWWMSLIGFVSGDISYYVVSATKMSASDIDILFWAVGKLNE